MANVKPVPDEYPQVSPYLSVDGAAAAIDWYAAVLGAEERMRMDGPDGRIGHAEIEIGRGLVMLADEHGEIGFLAPRSVGGTPVVLHVYVEDVDAVYGRALEKGATGMREPEDQFYGDRSAQFEDPFGHRWSIASRVEDVSPEEMARRAEQASH